MTSSYENRVHGEGDGFAFAETRNVELSQIALKYTSRISDLRKAGHDVVCVSRHRESGLTYYALRGE